jgi:hypothetical protein
VYSFGVILYELVTGLEPWSSLNPMQVCACVRVCAFMWALPAHPGGSSLVLLVCEHTTSVSGANASVSNRRRRTCVCAGCCAQVVGAVGFANQRLALPPNLDARVASIINHCWASDAAARPSFAQVCALLLGGCIRHVCGSVCLQCARTASRCVSHTVSRCCCCCCCCCHHQVLDSLKALKELPYTPAPAPASGPEASVAAGASGGEGSSGAAADRPAACGGEEGSMQRADSSASAGVTDTSGPLASLDSPSAAAAAAATATS